MSHATVVVQNCGVEVLQEVQATENNFLSNKHSTHLRPHHSSRRLNRCGGTIVKKKNRKGRKGGKGVERLSIDTDMTNWLLEDRDFGTLTLCGEGNKPQVIRAQAVSRNHMRKSLHISHGTPVIGVLHVQ